LCVRYTCIQNHLNMNTVKKLLLTLVIFASSFSAFSQTVSLAPQVLSAAGSYSQQATFSISQTIGEMTAVSTFSTVDHILTQGFQQGDLKYTVGIMEDRNFSAALDFFPNPTRDFTRIQYAFPQPGKLDIVIRNTLGQQVSERFSETYSQGTQSFVLQAQNLAAGVYYVYAVFTTENGQQHSFGRKLEVIQ
jgi:hypothetical protein